MWFSMHLFVYQWFVDVIISYLLIYFYIVCWHDYFIINLFIYNLLIRLLIYILIYLIILYWSDYLFIICCDYLFIYFTRWGQKDTTCPVQTTMMRKRTTLMRKRPAYSVLSPRPSSLVDKGPKSPIMLLFEIILNSGKLIWPHLLVFFSITCGKDEIMITLGDFMLFWAIIFFFKMKWHN